MADESREDELFIVSLWKHETERIIRDSLARFSDINWFDETISKIFSEIWSELKEEDLHSHFVTFPTESRSFQQIPARKEILPNMVVIHI